MCIYRTYRFTGSASHDEVFVNETNLAKLLNSEYAFTEVPSGTVVIAGLPVDPGVGAKEIRKLHLSKPVDENEEAKPGSKDSDKALTV